MATIPFRDLASSLVHTEGKNSYYFRIISYPDRAGAEVRKFGISQFYYCERTKRWYPSKHQVFLPLPIWSQLTSIGAREIQLHGNRSNGGEQLGHPGASNAAVEHSASVQQPETRRSRRHSECADEHANAVRVSSDEARATNGTQELDCEQRGRGAGERREEDPETKKLRVASEGTDTVASVVDDERTMPLFSQ